MMRNKRYYMQKRPKCLINDQINNCQDCEAELIRSKYGKCVIKQSDGDKKCGEILLLPL